jgi:hypothetical protein
MEKEVDFAEFKNGPAVSVFARLGDQWSDVLKRSTSFEDLRNSGVELGRKRRPRLRDGVLE